MGLDFAIDELYATGWSALDSSGCSHHSDGRAYPTVERVRREFAAAGAELTISHAAKFNCYRAEWSVSDSGEAGSVVGHSEEEAAVFALAQMRRSAAACPA